MMRWIAAGLGLSLLVGLAGCARPVIDYQAGADFASYQTVVLGPGDDQTTSIDQSRVDVALERVLPTRGLEIVERAGDLVLVTRFVEYKEYESNSPTWGIGGISGPVAVGISGPTRSREIKSYRLEIELVDPRANQVVWKARSAGALSESSSGPRRDQWVTDTIRAMFERWPPES